MPVRVPKYRLHKATGQALIQIYGKRIYLGKFDSPESRERYRRHVAELLTSETRPSPISSPQEKLVVNEVILAYYRFARGYYVKGGTPTDELAGIRAAQKRLNNLYGHLLADEFGPRAYKLVRESMIQEGRTRKYINDSMARIRRMFRWAASEELVSPQVYQALACIPGLRQGRSAAREPQPVQPVPEPAFKKTLKFLPQVVADMARVQRLCGCRPHEVCIMRPGDIDRSGNVWEYRPERHKSQHRDRTRVIFIGPRAQKILSPYLLRAADQFCFSPIESEAKRRPPKNKRRPRRKKTSPRPLAAPRRRRARRNSYDRHSYRRAIERACDRAKVERWSPNQLRHSTATEVRKRFGLEAAQTVLGHSQADVTQIYAERDMAQAKRVMREVG